MRLGARATAAALLLASAQAPAEGAPRLILARALAPTIVEDLRYAGADNFLHERLYTDARCWLRESVARKLATAAAILEGKMPGYRLKVWDCSRPLSVQTRMWAILPDARYVANPAKGSRHNSGAAVDLTIVDASGHEVEMPTAFDDFSEKAWAGAAASPEAAANRALLREVMIQAGFTPLRTEWWHFDG
jgi:D-alanyl-D-alanine dipeptidase